MMDCCYLQAVVLSEHGSRYAPARHDNIRVKSTHPSLSRHRVWKTPWACYPIPVSGYERKRAKFTAFLMAEVASFNSLFNSARAAFSWGKLSSTRMNGARGAARRGGPAGPAGCSARASPAAAAWTALDSDMLFATCLLLLRLVEPNSLQLAGWWKWSQLAPFLGPQKTHLHASNLASLIVYIYIYTVYIYIYTVYKDGPQVISQVITGFNISYN